ncbi:MAG: mercury resistance system transport protein MerF [Zetaproteobacteria bacterium]|nr:MAG: mercury resistance system transport protein MerF [Zetaproteobacteria bacterium]
MKKSTLLKTGIIGTAVAALCCFTPVLVILFGAVGLAAWVGYLDYVLMPALIFFVGLTIYAYTRKKKGECCESGSTGVQK